MEEKERTVLLTLALSHYLHHNKSVNYANACMHAHMCAHRHTDKGNHLCMCAKSAKSLRLKRDRERDKAVLFGFPMNLFMGGLFWWSLGFPSYELMWFWWHRATFWVIYISLVSEGEERRKMKGEGGKREERRTEGEGETSWEIKKGKEEEEVKRSKPWREKHQGEVRWKEHEGGDT